MQTKQTNESNQFFLFTQVDWVDFSTHDHPRWLSVHVELHIDVYMTLNVSNQHCQWLSDRSVIKTNTTYISQIQRFFLILLILKIKLTAHYYDSGLLIVY